MSEFKTSDSDSDDDAPPQLVDLPNVKSLNDKVVPITILTGFLGSGKTTLLNHILTAHHGKRIAVVENEFSSGLGIEGMIAKSGVDGADLLDFVELTNGCVCCSIKGDLLLTLEKLVQHKDRFDYIIIETTGLANPGPVISSFWSDDALMSNVKLDGVICLVDCLNIEQYLNSTDIANDVRTQICYSDRILLNKIDLVSPEQIPIIEGTIKRLNSMAEIQYSQYSKVNLDFVLNINGYSTVNKGGEMHVDIDRFVVQCMPCGDGDTSRATATYDAAAPKKKSSGDVSFPISEVTLRGLLHIKPVDGNSPHLASILMTHSVKMEGTFLLKPLEVYLDQVLFTARSDSVMAAVKADIAQAATSCASSPSSSAAVMTDALPIAPLHSKSVTDAVLSQHVLQLGDDGVDEINKIFRMKGVLHIHGCEYLYILQSVHEVFELTKSSIVVGSMADKTNSQNVFVVIGKNLDVAAIEHGLRQCLHTVL